MGTTKGGGNKLMATETTNYNLIKPDRTDFFSVDDFNNNMETIDLEIKEAQDKADAALTQDSKENTVTFTDTPVLANIVSGEKHSILFSKIKRFFDFIGTTALTTTEQTISKAINELVTKKLSIGNDYRPNILVNGDFRINSKGKSSYTTPNEMSVDKWMNYGLSTTITPLSQLNGGINVSCTYAGDINLIIQNVDDYVKYAGRTVTLSMKYKNFSLGSNTTVSLRVGDGVGSTVFNLNSSSPTSGTISVTRVLDSSLTQLSANMTKYGTGVAFSIDVEWMKLEVNDHPTPSVPKTNREEMLNCSDNPGYAPNILINDDFSIWQRGETFYNANNIYTADRWVVADSIDTNIKVYKSGTFRIEEYGAVGGMNAYTDITQRVEDYMAYAGKTLTLSVNLTLDSGVTAYIMIYDGTATYNTVATTTSGTQTITHSISAANTAIYAQIRFWRSGLAVGKGLNINWAKLELNDHASPRIPRNYGEKLALCQRYYIKLSAQQNDTLGFFFSATNGSDWIIPIPGDMRLKVPTVKVTGNFVLIPGGTQSVSPVVSVNVIGGCAYIWTAQGANSVAKYVATIDAAGAFVELDAEL